MDTICQTRSIGYKGAKVVTRPGQPLYGFSKPTNSNLKPETYERASTLLDEYALAVQSGMIESEFTPDSNHPRYGLSDNYFWIKKNTKHGVAWALVRTPVRDGDIIFIEKRTKPSSAE